MKIKKRILYILTLSMLLTLGAGCSRTPEADDSTIRVGSLTGPTAMGMVKLMDDSDKGLTANSYEFSLQSEAAAFVPALAKGELDIAAVPANLASVLYHNTKGAVKLLAINTLGVLNIVERGDSVRSFADLAGRTLYATGEGAAPEYALRYLLKEYGADGENAPHIQWCADTTEVLSYVISDETAVAMLPQPFVTAAQAKAEGLRLAIDMNEQWQKLGNGSKMVTGVLVCRRAFAEEHPDALKAFMEEYKSSVDFVRNNTEAAAELIGGYEIVKAPIALKALPYCNLTFLAGNNMKTAMEQYLAILMDLNPASVGGKLPDGDFYYGT